MTSIKNFQLFTKQQHSATEEPVVRYEKKKIQQVYMDVPSK